MLSWQSVVISEETEMKENCFSVTVRRPFFMISDTATFFSLQHTQQEQPQQQVATMILD